MPDSLSEATIAPLRLTNTALQTKMMAIETIQPFTLQTAEAKGREESVNESVEGKLVIAPSHSQPIHSKNCSLV
jgi:hypothetical protein